MKKVEDAAYAKEIAGLIINFTGFSILENLRSDKSQCTTTVMTDILVL